MALDAFHRILQCCNNQDVINFENTGHLCPFHVIAWVKPRYSDFAVSEELTMEKAKLILLVRLCLFVVLRNFFSPFDLSNARRDYSFSVTAF